MSTAGPTAAPVAGMVDEIVGVLDELGRPVDAGAIAHQLGGLEGLDPDDARAVVLATYGVRPDATPTDDFVPRRSPWRALTAVLRGSRPVLVYAGVAAIAGIIPGLIVPLLMGILVDRDIVSGDATWYWPVAIGIIIATLVAGIVAWLQNMALTRLAARINAVEQARLSWHALRLPAETITEVSPGAITGISGGMQAIGIRAGIMVPFAVVNVITAGVFAVALLLVDWRVGLAGIAVASVSILVIPLTQRPQRRREDEAAVARVALTTTSSEILSGIEPIKAAGWEQHAFNRWSVVRAEVGRTTSRRSQFGQWLGAVPALVPTLGFGVVLAIGAMQVMAGSLTLGTLVAAQSYLLLLLASAGLVGFVGALIESSGAWVAQADDLRARPIDPELASVPSAVRIPADAAVRGDLRGTSLVFGYDRNAPPLIEGLDIHVAPGMHLALVGGSGSGKSTIARLLIGEIRPWSGIVELDGVPRIAVHRRARARAVAYVPQEPRLFPGTIRENLSLWDDSVPDADLWRALDQACIAEAIRARVGGLSSQVVGGTGGFSGGELQRLAIARALVGDPRVLVLDEATSALDPVVEAQVVDALRRQGCTCIVIAHRLSTIRDADVIAVVEAGRIVQQGRFDELVGTSPFREMVHA